MAGRGGLWGRQGGAGGGNRRLPTDLGTVGGREAGREGGRPLGDSTRALIAKSRMARRCRTNSRKRCILAFFRTCAVPVSTQSTQRYSRTAARRAPWRPSGTAARRWAFTSTALQGVRRGLRSQRRSGRTAWYSLVTRRWPPLSTGNEWNLRNGAYPSTHSCGACGGTSLRQLCFPRTLRAPTRARSALALALKRTCERASRPASMRAPQSDRTRPRGPPCREGAHCAHDVRVKDAMCSVTGVRE
jgi:hypothetical protein